MIRINLLPFRAARKRENIKRQTTVFGLTLAFTLLVLLYLTIQFSSNLSGLKEEEGDLKAELKTYEKTINRINTLEKRIKEVKEKLGVINELEKNKTGPVHLLDEIAMAVPKNNLWLSSMDESKGSLTLRGTARNNETVALFMTNLEKSDFIKAVDLQSATLKAMPAHNLKASEFVLRCKTYAFKEKEKKKQKKKGKKKK
jgi:type IV pilus assembly protein PilN